jgi:hypothetical protein
MEPRLAPLVAALDLNTDLLLNCLEGLSDEEGSWRPAGTGNSAAFLAAHLIESRHYLAGLSGHPLESPLAQVLGTARSLDDVLELPTLGELREHWSRISGHLGDTLPRLSPADLDRRGVSRFPLEDDSLLGGIAFLVQHDSYHLGQVAFLRRQLGHPGMSYHRR